MHDPVRTCVGCRRRRPQRDLVRVVRGPDGATPDRQRRLPGRGAYVCPDPDCVAAAAARGGRALRRALRAGTDEDVLTALGAILRDTDDDARSDTRE